MEKQTVGMIQITVAAVCWGSLGFLGTLLNRAGFDGVQVATLRIVIAAAILLLLLPYFMRFLRGLDIKRLPILTAQSLIGVLGMSLLYFAAVAKVGSSLAVALLYTAPVWSLIFSCMLLGEPITRKAAMLTVVAALGVGLTMAGGMNFDALGIMIGLGSGICYALYGVLGKKVMTGAPPMMLLFTSVSISALALLCLPATHQTLAQLVALDVSVWLTAFALSLVGTIIAFGLFVKGLEKMPAAKAAVFTVFEPFTAVMLAVFLLGEQLGVLQSVGVFLIIAVAVLNAVGKKEKMEQALG
ncbi:EamA family transporter [Neisseria sp. N95_16]|uniref:EamA family transporter n=1 Tax=Neisseria brasiliensis TaxID=2666100 RepID=A0A7X2GZ30_9NEIS|nr:MULTISPECIES: EamA family transporter [Neisseria]MRN38631.1 EamA family transporter [Neisseria brasiliensis]PJO10729.1 EamA family transporter [Neisseria sp. N95_16]